MISSTSFLNKTGLLLIVILFYLLGCVGPTEEVKRNVHADEEKFSVAVFPIENLSGTVAPLKDIRESLIDQLKTKGFQVLEQKTLEQFMARNRIRYTGGIDEGTAQALRTEIGIEGVLITSLELYSETNPPKIALTSRLVSTGDRVNILWMDGVGMAGDDSPGILGLGLIENPRALLTRALDILIRSYEEYFYEKRRRDNIQSVKKKFQPKASYRSDVFDPGRKYAVAVAPFLNRSERRNAGKVMELHFIRNLKKYDYFDVIEPGIVRRHLLRFRMIIDKGISLADVDALSATLDADLILTGKVIDYQDYQGSYGKPKVDFSVQLIEKKSGMILWSSVSYNEGDDGVFFFDRGRVNTAHAMASQMVRAIGKVVVQGK